MARTRSRRDFIRESALATAGCALADGVSLSAEDASIPGLVLEGTSYQREPAGQQSCASASTGKHLKDPFEPSPLKLIQSTLASRDSRTYPVCRPFQNKSAGFTFASTVMVLSEQPEFLVSKGPPDKNAYQKLVFADQ